MANSNNKFLIATKRNSIVQAIKYTLVYLIIGFLWAVAYDNNANSALETGISLNNIHISEFFFLSISALFLFLYLKQYNDQSNSTERYAETVFEHSASAILVCDRQGNIIQANNACCKLTQYSMTEIYTKNYISLISAADNENIKRLFSTLKINATSQNIETQLISKQGEQISINAHKKCVVKNGIEIILVFFDEATPIKKLMVESLKNEALFNSIFELVPVGIKIVNLDTGMRLNINKYACDLLGDTKDNLLAKKGLDKNIFKSKNDLQKAINILKTSKQLSAFITKIVDKKGNIKDVNYNAILLNNSTENIALISMTDITEQRTAINNISALAQTISHHSGSDFYNFAITQVAMLFESSHAFISVINDENPEQMDTLAYCINEQICPNFSYNITKSPSSQIINNDFCYFPNNVQNLFTKDTWLKENNIQGYLGIPLHNLEDHTIGALVLLFDHPINLTSYYIDIIKIFAAKITSELKHQELRKQSLTTYQHLNFYKEQSPLASLEWDTNFKLQSCNQAAEKILGYSLGELQKMDFVDQLVPKSEQQQVIQTCNDLLAERGGTINYNSLIIKSNRVILTEWHNALIKDDSNTAIGAVSIFKNITEENKIFTRVAAKEKENREILNSMVDAVITINGKGEILSLNSSTVKLFGYNEQELIGNNISLLMPKPTAVKHNSYIENYQKTKQAKIIGNGREVIALRKNSQEFPIRLTLAELSPDENGDIRYVGTCHDLTEIKQQQNTMQRIQKMDALGKLTGGISHDFNNILGVILGFSELLEQQLKQQPKLAKYCQQIIRASERGSDLTRKLLSFSKQKNTQTEEININDLLNAIKPMLEKSLTALITISYQLADNLWTTNIDLNGFDDAILNLCINAKYAMPQGGLLSISTYNISLSAVEAKQHDLVAADYICLTITDNGSGMNNEVKAHIFEPFFTTKGTDGTGLGLSQVYGFVKASKGSVNVYSELHIGTSFTFYFPKSNSNSNSNKNNNKDATNLTGHETILVVDDEPALGLLAKTILENNGYTVYNANSASEALGYLEKESIDLLLTDIIMPNINGYQLVDKIRAAKITLPIIFASGFEGETNVFSKKYKDITVISKPYISNTLLINIRNQLDNKHLIAQ